MSKLSAEFPVNSVSFGAVGYNVLKELVQRETPFDFLPTAGNMDFSSFNAAPDSLKSLLTAKARSFHKDYNSKNPSLSLWHIRGSEKTLSRNNTLFTFHELDTVTEHEINVLNQQSTVVVSCAETKDVFESHGVKTPVKYVPLGFDSAHFHATGKQYLDKSITVWLIHGKYEPKRKSHDKVIKAWLQKYGNKREHRLHLHIYNPFFNAQQNQAVAMNLLGGKQYDNVNFYGYTKTLGELNDSYNCSDIVIDGGNEGWSLPSFHCVGLGKHGVVFNVMGIKGWANKDNSVLIEPESKIPAEDGIFFHKNDVWNQGNFYSFSVEQLMSKYDEVYARKMANPVNSNGLKIQEEFTWAKTVDLLLGADQKV